MNVLALNPIALRLGPIKVHWYGVIIASAVILAVYLASREAKRRGLEVDDIYDAVLWAMPIALIAARTYYVVFEWAYYKDHLSQIPAIWDGGIAIYGGLLGGLAVIIVLTKHKMINTWLFLDIIAPTIILSQAIGRWGNFMNQEAYGKIVSHQFLTNLHIPNFIVQQMFIDGYYRMPTYLWESLWDVTGFIIIMIVRHQKNWFKQGEIFFLYVMWYAFGRFFIEGMRTDSLMIAGDIRVSQILSVILFIGSLIWWILRRKLQPQNRWYLDGHSLLRNI